MEAGSTQKPSRKFIVFVVREQVKRQKVRIPTAAKVAPANQRIKEDAPCHLQAHSITQQAGSF